MADSFVAARGGDVRIDPRALADLFRSPEGPAYRMMVRVGEKVQTVAFASLKEGFPRDFLGPTLVKRIVVADDGPHVLIGSDKTRTRPHRIEGNPVLAFPWPRMGLTMAYFHHVDHPGSDFTKYLSERLLIALREVRLAL